MTASDSSTALLPPMTQVYVTPATLALVGVISALSYVAYTFQRHRKLPPGPAAVPLLGSLPFINMKAFNKDCIRLAQKYGDIFSLYLGPRLVVVLNDFISIREAFVNHGIVFSGRFMEDLRNEIAMPYHPTLGEQQAHQQLILFPAYIMHTFHVQFDDDHRPESLEADYNGLRQPKPYKIRVTPRF